MCSRVCICIWEGEHEKNLGVPLFVLNKVAHWPGASPSRLGQLPGELPWFPCPVSVCLCPHLTSRMQVCPLRQAFFHSCVAGVGTVSQPPVIQTPKLYSGVWRLRGQGVLETDSGAGCTVLWVHLLPQD